MSDSKPDTVEESASSREDSMLIDRFGRPVNNLRISLTQRCDHQCFFCHKEGEFEMGSELSIEEIGAFVHQAVKFGVTSVKLTGGEPLMRSDIVEIVKSLAPLVNDLSMTTNGTMLKELAAKLKESGLDRVNVSLHTLRAETHRALTGVDDIDKVKQGLLRAIEVGLRPVKINMTVIRGYNDDEIDDMIEYCGKIGAHLQLIELQEMPELEDFVHEDLWVDMKQVERRLEAMAFKIEQRDLHWRKRYSIMSKNGPVVVEIVRSMRNPEFCQHCTRIRITSKGQVKPCLMRSDNLIDARRFIGSEKGLIEAIERAVQMREPYWQEDDMS